MSGRKDTAHRVAARSANTVARCGAIAVRRPERAARRNRVFSMLLVAALTWIGVSVFTADRARSDNDATAVTSYTVRPGDTLWSYAASVTPQGGDVNDTVDELIALNDLEGGALRAGQRIMVPLA